MKFEKNTELDQANLRLIVATCAILYVVLIGLLPGLKVETYLPIVAYYGLFLIASILLRQAIVRWPGHTRRGGSSACCTTTPAPRSA